MKCRSSKIGHDGCDLSPPLFCTLCSMPSMKIKPYMNSNNVWCKKLDTHLQLYLVANVYPFFCIRLYCCHSQNFCRAAAPEVAILWVENHGWNPFENHSQYQQIKGKLVVSILRWSQQPSFFAANNSLYPKAPYVTCIWQWKN